LLWPIFSLLEFRPVAPYSFAAVGGIGGARFYGGAAAGAG